MTNAGSCLRRAEVTTEHDGAAIRVKLAERPGGARTAKAAHDDVASEPGLDRRRATRERRCGAR